MESVLRPGKILRHTADRRQLFLMGVYYSLLMGMYFVPVLRNPLCLMIACAGSFLNSVVIHNHLHAGIFRSERLNLAFRCLLSFGVLYPASANIPSHNIVHHLFDDDGADDWSDTRIVRFRWNLLNLIHFPNISGTQTFGGIQRWLRVKNPPGFAAQYYREQIFAFGLTALLLVNDFWTGLFFIVVPQLWGARWILRINIIQHDGCDIRSKYNHSRNFVGKTLNWLMCNNGYHTMHHNQAGMHWALLPEAHQRIVKPVMDPSLDERSMFGYLWRTYGWNLKPRVRALDTRPMVDLPKALSPAELNAAMERLTQAAKPPAKVPAVPAGGPAVSEMPMPMAAAAADGEVNHV